MRMKAWIIEGFAGIEKARLIEAADPRPAAGEVVLRLNFAALNPADRYLAMGEYPAKPPMPHILGRDGSGVIAAVGSGVQGHSIGQRRAILRGDMGVSRWGTFAELVAVPTDSLIEIPRAGLRSRLAVHRWFM
jgi:NADPH2:quinone reductase